MNKKRILVKSLSSIVALSMIVIAIIQSESTLKAELIEMFILYTLIVYAISIYFEEVLFV